MRSSKIISEIQFDRDEGIIKRTSLNTEKRKKWKKRHLKRNENFFLQSKCIHCQGHIFIFFFSCKEKEKIWY